MKWKKSYKQSDHARTGNTKKFGNKKQNYDGVDFDSKLEVDIYKELVNSPLLSKVIPHPEPIRLLDGVKHPLTDGKDYVFREVVYKPDFCIYDLEGNPNYIDVKSFPTITPEFIIKFKLCYSLRGIYINIITKQAWKGEQTIQDILEGKHYSALSKNKLNSL